jgi:kynureninase
VNRSETAETTSCSSSLIRQARRCWVTALVDSAARSPSHRNPKAVSEAESIGHRLARMLTGAESMIAVSAGCSCSVFQDLIAALRRHRRATGLIDGVATQSL